MKRTILLVDDDEGLRESLERSVRRKGHEVQCASRVAGALERLRSEKIDLVLLDMKLPDGSGLDVLTQARSLDPEILVVVMTAYPDVKTAVRAMKEGAADFLVKPFDLEELHRVVSRALETRELRFRLRRLERECANREETSEILGESRTMDLLRGEIARVAPTATPVLVLGETGTGKELVADSIHRLSDRREGPLVKVNCSAFSEQILESELFGHERGAFTDAREARAGLFEMTDGGTLFLDEISEMKLALQAKLLRAIEGHSFRRVGGSREIRTDVRVLAATNRDLLSRVREGHFREDLYFRLAAFPILVPPLREREADVALLARFFLHRSAAALRKGPIRLLTEAEEILLAYGWPGNVRELKNVMERAAILCDSGAIGPLDLPPEIQATSFLKRSLGPDPRALPSLADMERRYIEHVLRHVGGNLSEAARMLGIARNTLKARLRDAAHAPP